jgi:hypothetical protein
MLAIQRKTVRALLIITVIILLIQVTIHLIQTLNEIMRWGERLKGLAVAFMLLIICMPLDVGITFLSSPLWRWLENSFAIESFGHSGPAEWCYLVAPEKVLYENFEKNI